MEGSNPAGQGQSERSPATPSSSTYQVNVNRKKTKKWVEAKVQSYDGDDWGAPESDEEPESPPPPPPAVPKPVDAPRLPSETRIPGSGRSYHAPAGSSTSNLSGSGGQLPQAQTQQQPPALEPTSERSGEAGISAESESPAVDYGASEGVVSPQPGRSMEGGEQTREQTQDGSAQESNSNDGPSKADAKRMSVSPQLPNVARMSTFGADLFDNSDLSNKPLAAEPTVVEERESSPEPTGEDLPSPEGAKEGDPTTAGPKEPPMPLSPSPPADTAAEPEVSIKSHEAAAGQTTTQLAPGGQPDEHDVSPISEHDEASREFPGPSTAASEADSTKDSQKNLQVGADARSLPPLRTPSPHEPRTVHPVSDDTATQPVSPEKAPAEITPTEPLQPKKPETSPSDYEPQPLNRQLTLDTVASSPVKESDVLSDEIMKTLTPGGIGSTDRPDNQPKPQVTRTGRESSYTLSGYDDYWEDTGDQVGNEAKTKSATPGGLGDVPEHPPAPSTEAKASEPTPISPESFTTPPLSGGQGGVRRRFSWEAEEEQEEPPNAGAAVLPDRTAAPNIQPQQETQPSGSLGDEPSKHVASPSPTLPATEVVQGSSQPPAGNPVAPEPPSPVSEMSDRDATPLAQSREPQLPSTADEGAAPSATSPALTSQKSGGPEAQMMAFREIMNMSTSTERISKYDETRNVFATMESGLDNWTSTMRSEYPEHARATPSFSGAAPASPPSANGPSVPPQENPAQQPYYQQYLNASAPASSTGSARSRLAGLPGQAQAAAGSAFGHSGNQIGTKSKEFMHSAGKMGKGLFSKGKSRLRGDKGDASPPPVDRKPQGHGRRMSWARNFGPKSQGDAPAPRLTTEGPPAGSPINQKPSAPPQLAAPSLSPFLSHDSPTSQKVFWQSPLPGTEDKAVDGQYQGNARVEAKPQQGAPDQRNVPLSAGHAQSISDDWAMAPRQLGEQRDTVAPEQNGLNAPKVAPTPVAEDSGVGMSSQPDYRPEAKRNSSFKGLPPIRTDSSFGLTTFAATQQATERFSLHDDNAGPTQNGTRTQDAGPANPSDGALPPADNATNQSLGDDSNATLVGQDSTSRTGRTSLSQKEPMRVAQPPGQQLQVNNSVPNQRSGDQAPQAEQPDAVNPIQRQPPSGWQLEESHLTEPLHPVGRKRAGTDSSQQQVSYDYDKETGVAMPTSPTLPPGPAPQVPRGRTSDVPPSSARRYPELFRPAGQQLPPQQRGRADPYSQPMPGYGPQPPRMSLDSAASIKAREAGYEVSPAPSDDRGRRRSAGIFKGIGDRVARATSRERRSSVAGQRPEQVDSPAEDPRGPGEEAREPKKKRSSFLPSLRSRASVDMVASQRPESPARPQTQDTAQATDPPATPQSEKKRSFLGAAAGRMSAAQHKFIPGSFSRTSTSSPVNDTSSMGGSDSTHSAPKKRFSGLADKAAGFAGKFHRPVQENPQKPGTPLSAVSSSTGFPYGPTASQASLDPPPTARGRSGTAGSGGSFSMTPPPAPDPDPQEHRGRRGSFSGMVSNLMGSRSSSKARQSEETATSQAASKPPPFDGSQVHPISQYPPQGYIHQPGLPRELSRTSMDGSPRAVKHLSGQSMQPPRPSPLAQESSVTGGGSPGLSETNRSAQSIPPNQPLRADSPSLGSTEGKQGAAPAAEARDSMQSPGASVPGGEQANQPPPAPSEGGEQGDKTVSQSAEGTSRSSTPHDMPTSPVKRQATPHSTSLLSMSAATEPQSSVPGVPTQNQSAAQTSEVVPPQGARPVGPVGHMRTESGVSQATQRSRDGAPNAQPQQQGPPPLVAYGNQAVPPQQQPATPAGPPDGRRVSSKPLANASGPPAQQGLEQPPQQVLPNQVRITDGRYPGPQPDRPPMQQPFTQQGVPAQSQSTAVPSEAQEPKWKGWKTRVSDQMAQMTAQSGQEKPEKGSWKSRVSSQFAQINPSSGQEKPEKDNKSERESWMNRVSGQLAQMAPQSGQDKPEKGDKSSTGDKLFGAFKKSSKSAEPTQPPPPPPKNGEQMPPRQQPAQQQWRPTPTALLQAPPGAPQQQYTAQPAYGQYYQGQMPGQHTHPGQYQYQQAQWNNGPHPDQLAVAPHQPQWAYGQQMAAHHQQQQTYRPPEPQYDQVPIPKSYSAVHGEGTVAPTNYNVGRQMAPPAQYLPGQQTSIPQQGYYPQSQLSQPAGQYPAGPRQHVSPPPAGTAMSQQQQAPGGRRPSSVSPGEDGGFNLPIQGNVTPGEGPLRRLQKQPAPQQDRPPPARTQSVASDTAQSVESGVMGGMGQRILPGQSQDGHQLQAKPSTTSIREEDQGPSSASAPQGQSRAASLSPDAALEGKAEPKAKDLSVDVAKSKGEDMDGIYDATPRLKADQTGESREISDVSKSNTGGSGKTSAKEESSEAHHAELEDTADARMRTLRLGSQEEKIYYDPEGDIPKMSATSYPGQEWNPYGEPEFALADFND